jgi:lysozyme
MIVTPGIDVSHLQGRIDWPKVAAGGTRFAILRATYGSQLADSQFAANWDGAKSAGLVVSAYHFTRWSQPPDGQMDRFLSAVGDRQPDLPLVLDVERDPYGPGGETSDQVTSCLRQCIDRVVAAGHASPMLYTAPAWWNANVARSDDWQAHHLWVANYGVAQPRVPRDWSSWRFWQYGGGSLPGIGRSVDLDWFAGPIEDLLALGGAPAPAVSAPALTVRCIAAVNVRNGPSIKFAAVGSLSPGDTVGVRDLSGEDVWVLHGPGRWSSLRSGGAPTARLYLKPDGNLVAQVVVRGLNIRTEADARAEKVGVLSQGDEVAVTRFGGTDVWVEWAPGKWTAYRSHGQKYLSLGDDIAKGGPGRALRKRPRSDDG